jgi:ArsR family transcriptional regulator
MKVKKWNDDRKLIRAAEILRAVAHPVRLRMIEVLERGEHSVTELQDSLGTTQSLTSQHLGHLKVRGILKSRKKGNVALYSIENVDVVKVIRCIRGGTPR